MAGRHAAPRNRRFAPAFARANGAQTDHPTTTGRAPVSASQRKLRRGGSTALMLQGSGVALQYATQLVFSRSLGAGAFGTYTYAYTWNRLAGSLCHLGGASSALRLLPQYKVTEEWSMAAGVVRRFVQTAIVVGTIFAASAAAILLMAGGTSTTNVAIALAVAFVPVASLIELLQAMIRAFERVFRAFFPFLVLQPIVLIAAVAGFLVAGTKPSLKEALLLTGASYVVTVLLQAWWLYRGLPAQVRRAKPVYATREWAKVTGPIFLSNAIYLVFSRLDVVMVGILRSPREAGIYAVAMRAGGMISILQTAMASSLAPRISHLYWSGRRDEVEEVTLKAVYWLFVPTLALTVVLSVFAGPVLSLFGKAFTAGAWVLVFTAIGQLISVSSGAVGWVMNMTGHQNVTTVVYAFVAAVTMAGYFLLIPSLGMNGAAIANSGAVALRNIALNALVRRRLGYHISVLRAFRAR